MLVVSWVLLVPLPDTAALTSRAVLGIFDNCVQNPCLTKAKSVWFFFLKHEGWLCLDEAQGWGFFSVPMSHGFIMQV